MSRRAVTIPVPRVCSRCGKSTVLIYLIDSHPLCSICAPKVQAEIRRAMVEKRKGVVK